MHFSWYTCTKIYTHPTDSKHIRYGLGLWILYKIRLWFGYMLRKFLAVLLLGKFSNLSFLGCKMWRMKSTSCYSAGGQTRESCKASTATLHPLWARLQPGPQGDFWLTDTISLPISLYFIFSLALCPVALQDMGGSITP